MLEIEIDREMNVKREGDGLGYLYDFVRSTCLKKEIVEFMEWFTTSSRPGQYTYRG